MVPEGVGFARIKPTRNGSARFKTTMPDFASFTKGYPLIPANPGQGKLAGYEVAANPYGKNGGSVSGRAEVGYDGALAADSILADLDWARKPAAEMRRRHPGFLQGFNIAALLQGFTYSKPSAGIPIGFNTNPIGPNATLTLRGGNLPESPLSYPITIHNGRGEQSGPPDTASAPSQLGLKLKFTFSQGVFIGSFVHPRSGNRIKFIGGISSLERRCRGLFLSPEFLDSFGKNKNTGRVEITPRAP